MLSNKGKPLEPVSPELFWTKVRKTDTCWLWIAAGTGGGYGAFKPEGKYGPRYSAHRMSWVYANGPIPDGLVVCHKCDNKKCVNPDHLFLGTHKDNSEDMVKKGRQARGEHSGPAKFTADMVRSIRQRLAAGERGNRIATELGVTGRSIYCIRDRVTWKHVE